MAEDNVVIKVSLEGDYSDIENLDEIIEGLREKANGIPLDFDETPAQDDVDGLQDQLEGFSMLAVGDVLQGYGASAEGMAQQMNTASISVGQLSKNVGMAEPQMVSMINNISNATFPQSEAIAYANALNQMGVSADQLGSSATNMDRINDATGIGYSKVIQLTQGLRSMGIEGNNLPSAFNAIAYAQANVNGGADTLTQVLKRQAGTISEYGLNVDQVAVIMQKLSEKGVQGMKMGSELSAVLKETNGDTAALEQELGLTAGSLSNAASTTGEYEGQLQSLADEEAEHKTWLDQLGAAAEDASLSLSGIAEPFMGLIGLGGGIAGFGMQLNGAWELISKLSPALKNLSIMTKLSAAADWLLSAAQGVLNAVMSMNPIMLVVIALVALAAALIWAYYNVDWFREMVDNAFASLVQIGQQIYSYIAPAIQWLSDLFNQFTSQLGLNTNDWLQAILGFILFLPTLPLQAGIALANTIAKALGFGDNFVQRLVTAGMNAVNGFISYITQIPSMVYQEFQRTLQLVNDFINSIPQKVWDMGVAIIDALKGALGIGSPGHMFYMIEGEFNRIDDLTRKTNFDTGSIGQSMVDNFNPSLNGPGVQGASGNNITINIDNVDNEERIQQIVRAVEEALKFDNLKAGRSV